MPEDDSPPPPLSPNVVKVLGALANELERMLTPVVDASFDAIAKVAFVQGTLGPYEVREAVVPESTGHHLHVCLNVLREQLRGVVTVELMSSEGTVLRTERAPVSLPKGGAALARRHPRPLGIVNLLVPVSADVDWGAVVSARLTWVPEDEASRTGDPQS